MMKINNVKNRILSLLLCAILLCGFAPVGIASAVASEGLCEHHTEHTEDCGYSKGTEGIPCTHEHTDECYTLETNCVHTHDETCYPAPAVSDSGAAPSDADEAEPTECTHVCSEESGCITKTLACTHVHNESCGYVEAVAATPCTFVCEICSKQETVDSGAIGNSTLCEEHSFGAWTINEESGFERKCTVCGESETSEEPDFLSGLTELETADDIEAIAAELDRLYEEEIIDRVCYETLSSVFLDGAALFSAEGAKEYSGPINDSETYSFTGTIDPIIVESGSPTIILNGVTITATNAPAIWIKAGATVNLKLEGESNLTGGAGCAGICVDPDYEGNTYSPDKSAKLTVSGSGSLKATGGDGDPTGGMFGGGAGIGGNGQNYDGAMGGVDFGIIEFSEQFTGTIKAYGGIAYAVSGNFNDDACSFGGGAGIGSGGFDCANFDWYIVCGRINIYNGTIIANDGLENATVGAGIGSGTGGLTQAWFTDFSDVVITIAGGDIVAQGGGLSAGIGGGSLCDGGNVNISGGTVMAKAGAAEGALGASGIGGGNDSGLYRIDITGGQVTAIASGGSAGIGGASNTSYSNLQYGDMYGDRSDGKVGIINISGKDTVVNAYGGSSGTFGGAGIGAGNPVANNDRSVAFDISITNGATVNAYGGYHAQAVGYGYYPGRDGEYYTGYGIKLVLDDTISLWAQNYDCFQPALVATTKYDDNPITYKSDEKYLVVYMDENREATEAVSGEAQGYLEWGKEQPAESFEWDYSNGKLSIADSEIRAVEDLKGNWTTLYSTPKVTVTFDLNYDGAPESQMQTVEKGNTVAAPDPAPTRSSYVFQGWYTAADGGERYDFSQPVVNDITLYAQWRKSGGNTAPEDPTPTKPTEPTTPTNPDRPLGPPQTGDDSNAGLWVALACLSLFSMAALTFGKKRFGIRRSR